MIRRRAGLFLLLAGICAAAAFVKIRSYDFWWHLQAGEQIVRERSIPRADDFSFTSAGTPWIDHEWLFQVLAYGAFSTLGAAGVWLIKAACAFGVAAVGYRWRRRSGSPAGMALLLACLAILGLRFRLAERPEAVSLLMSAAVAALVLGLVTRPARPTGRLVLTGLLAALWSNLHAGALAAPAIGIACAAGALFDLALAHDEQARGDERRGAANACAAALAAAAGVMINPFGPRIFSVPWGISEALSPGNLVNPEWLTPSPRGFPFFYLSATSAGFFAVAGIARRSRHALCRAALLSLAAAAAITSVRHIGIFFALLPLVLEIAPPRRRFDRPLALAGTLACLAAAFWMALVPPPGAASGIGVQEGRYPVQAADFIEARLDGARLYNDAAFGGYLIWRGYPQRRVFLDGRNEVHAALLRDLSAALDDGRRWQDLLARHDVEGAVVAYRPDLIAARDASTGAMARSTFSELHFPEARWALAYWDDVAMVFIRRQGRFQSLAAKLEYRRARPEAFKLNSLNVGETGEAGGIKGDAALVEEIRRKLAEDPRCELAKEMSTVYHAGRPPDPL